jgi:ribose transport system substrate-binding protein
VAGTRTLCDRRRTGLVRPAAWLGTLLALGLAGCGGGEPTAPPTSGGAAPATSTAEKPRFLFITNSNADWWTAVEKGMTDAGTALGCQVEMRRNEKEVPGQIRLLEDAISLPDVKGVAVSVYEASAPGIADAMRELRKQGKLVIAIDSDIAPAAADARSAYIGTNNREAGRAAGKAGAKIRPQGGKVCVFVGTSSAANAIERREGFFEGAGDKFVQTEIFDDGSDKARAASNVQTALSKYSDVGVLLGLWSYNAPRIAEEASASPEMRKKLSVVTFDLDELAVGHLEAGRIDATICQNPYEIGYQGVKLLKALAEKDDAAIKDVLPDGKSRDTGVRIIVPSKDSPVKGENVITIEEMKTWMSGKGLKSS